MVEIVIRVLTISIYTNNLMIKIEFGPNPMKHQLKKL